MLYPRFLLTFSKNKYNNIKFYNEEFLRVQDKTPLINIFHIEILKHWHWKNGTYNCKKS